MSENSTLAYIQDFYMNKNLKALRQLPKLFSVRPSFNAKGELSIEDFITAISETGLELGENEYHVN